MGGHRLDGFTACPQVGVRRWLWTTGAAGERVRQWDRTRDEATLGVAGHTRDGGGANRRKATRAPPSAYGATPLSGLSISSGPRAG